MPHHVGLGPHVLRAGTAALAAGVLLAALRAGLVTEVAEVLKPARPGSQVEPVARLPRSVRAATTFCRSATFGVLGGTVILREEPGGLKPGKLFRAISANEVCGRRKRVVKGPGAVACATKSFLMEQTR